VTPRNELLGVPAAARKKRIPAGAPAGILLYEKGRLLKAGRSRNSRDSCNTTRKSSGRSRGKGYSTVKLVGRYKSVEDTGCSLVRRAGPANKLGRGLADCTRTDSGTDLA
jgi:hypothetical protein